MKDVLSKKLLSEVLNDSITHIFTKEDDKYIQKDYIVYIGKDERRKKINIHELTSKCKEWAFEQGYYLDSGICEKGGRCFIATKEMGSMYTEKTEQEAILKATQWIYEKTKD